MAAVELTFETGHGTAHALCMRPRDAEFCYVLAHGAGAGMRHAFLNDIAERLAARSIATLRYEFLYMSAGGKRPDREPVLLDTVRAAVAHARSLTPDLPLFAGGKSMGGRMTSRAASRSVSGDKAQTLDTLNGIIFIGFPLHPPKRVSSDRAAHLQDVVPPMLFLQGTRDDLADLDSIRAVTGTLPRATLHISEGADHSFHVLKRSGRTDDEVMEDLCDTMLAFMKENAQRR